MEKYVWIHLFHIILVTGLFLYIGIMQTKLPKFIYPILIGLGIVIILYHIYKSIYKKAPWLNYIHIFYIGPLLVYIGYKKENTPRIFFEIILMFAFASFGYHLYYLIFT
jgi:hypothetical protein|uniref:Uncharacterized protein n=1 Tax=viral metagenome TaxID=1070528 RepID=A0A6C0E3Q6_9ZZZZ